MVNVVNVKRRKYLKTMKVRDSPINQSLTRLTTPAGLRMLFLSEKMQFAAKNERKCFGKKNNRVKKT